MLTQHLFSDVHARVMAYLYMYWNEWSRGDPEAKKEKREKEDEKRIALFASNRFDAPLRIRALVFCVYGEGR